MAFARVKIRWAKMDAVKLATEGPPAGKEHRTLERYFDDVLKGSRIMAEQCAKDIFLTGDCRENPPQHLTFIQIDKTMYKDYQG